MDGGVLGFMEAASPLLNLVAPGLGTAVGLGTNLVASQASSPSPSTYTPLTPNTNKYGLQNGGPTPPPDSTYQRTLEMLSEFPITPSEALSRRVALSKYNDVVRSQEAIPEISGRLIPQGKINAYNTYAVKKSTPNFLVPEVARASTYVAIPTLVGKPKMEKGGPIKHRGWEYKQENNEIYTRKEGSAEWIVPQGQAREAIIKRIYPDFGQATAPTAAPRTAPSAPLAPLGRVTPEVQANTDRTITQAASKQSAGFGQGDYIPTVIGPEVPVVGQPVHPQHKFFQYDRPDTLEKIADFQRSQGLTPDAKWGRKTASAYTQQTSPDRLAVRKAYQDKVRQAAQDLAAQDNPQLRMYDEVYQSLMKTPQAKHINHCIGGVCTFLDRDVEPGIFKGAGQKDIFISNFEFDKKAQEMGWDRYDHKSNVEPEVGDILQYKYFTSRRRHAQLIIDTDPKKGYKTLDNGGKGPARFQWISKGDFEGR